MYHFIIDLYISKHYCPEVLGSVRFFLKEFQKEYIKLIKSDSENILLQKIFISNICSSDLSIHQKMHYSFHKNIKQYISFQL